MYLGISIIYSLSIYNIYLQSKNNNNSSNIQYNNNRTILYVSII